LDPAGSNFLQALVYLLLTPMVLLMDTMPSLIPEERQRSMLFLRWLGIYTQNEIEYDKAL
jgi:hypothetical protein